MMVYLAASSELSKITRTTLNNFSGMRLKNHFGTITKTKLYSTLMFWTLMKLTTTIKIPGELGY